MLRPLRRPDEIEGSTYIRVRVRKKVDFHLMNVDLEFESKESVQPLIKELGDKVYTLYCSDTEEMGNLELAIETRNGVDFYQSYNDVDDWVGGADAHIDEFCKLIKNLSPKSRKIWDKCHKKEFDIGFQCGNTIKTFRTSIKAETIHKCAEIGASMMVTTYPHQNFEYHEKEYLKKKKVK
jgi:hypothetical protein